MTTQRVKLSTYSIVITIVAIAIMVGVLIMLCLKDANVWKIYVISAAVVALLFGGLFYAPISVSVDDNELSVNRTLRKTMIPLADIKSVKLCPPTLAEKRICGSGGWFGYWGWFSEKDLGKYFAYYGKASDCFLVTLKNGKKYMIGCENPQSIVDAIQKRIG